MQHFDLLYPWLDFELISQPDRIDYSIDDTDQLTACDAILSIFCSLSNHVGKDPGVHLLPKHWHVNCTRRDGSCRHARHQDNSF